MGPAGSNGPSMLYDSLWFGNLMQGGKMAGKTAKIRPWTKEDIRMLKMLAREKIKTTVIARKLKRSVQATYQKASALGVTLGVRRKKKG
jgi:hypothetical protein